MATDERQMEGQGGAHGAVGVEKGEGKEKEADDNGVDPFYSGAVGEAEEGGGARR
jgi:hypothetical protein